MPVLFLSILRQLSFVENRESLCPLVFSFPITSINYLADQALPDFLISLFLQSPQGLDRPCYFVWKWGKTKGGLNDNE